MPAAYNPKAKTVLIFTPTPNEYRAVKKHVSERNFKNLLCRVIECGPGRLMSAFAVARELNGTEENIILAGAGTSGSLDMELKRGSVIVSDSALISDWRMEQSDEVTLSPYGWFDYQLPTESHVEKMVLACNDPLITELMNKISAPDFVRGRLLTSEGFVAGKELKLSYGKRFGCIACDMESGAFGYMGNHLVKVPWFNVRVVADTLDDSLADYFAIEKDVTEVLGNKLAEVLNILDSLIIAPPKK